jgi:5-methylcytosine-specific restriction endonuclease McrA
MRKEFSKKTRAEVFLRANGICEKCGIKLKPGEGEYDHVVPAYFGGDNTAGNAALLCVPCHRGVGAKTADDQRIISKVKRVKAKHEGSFPPSLAKIKSRGFAKTRNF